LADRTESPTHQLIDLAQRLPLCSLARLEFRTYRIVSNALRLIKYNWSIEIRIVSHTPCQLNRPPGGPIIPLQS
jgi:hypothetical protein